MGTKICRKCGGDPKPLDEFYAHPQMADGRLNVCKGCCRAANNARPRDPDKKRDRLAQWRADNPERWKEYQRRAQEKARGNGTAARSSKARVARVAAARVDPISIKSVYAAHGMVCGICGLAIADPRQVTLDHVIPLARGGAHATENLRPAHRRCNSWKGDRLPEELMGQSPPEPGVVDDWEERRRQKISAATSERSRNWFKNATPEQLEARAAKISAATKGKPKLSPGNRMGGARKSTPEQNAHRAAQVKAAWSRKTPEELEAWKAKCRTVKEGSTGNIENLRKGWDPDVQKRARTASAEARRRK